MTRRNDVGGVARRLALGPLRTSSRPHLEGWVAEYARTTPAGGLVLDAGSGDAPYREQFAHARYVSADFKQVRTHYARGITLGVGMPKNYARIPSKVARMMINVRCLGLGLRAPGGSQCDLFASRVGGPR